MKDRHNYYLDIAETVSEEGTCLRRNYGSVIVKNDEIISTGYTGAPRGCKDCIKIGKCYREENNIPRGTRYEMCLSVHSEMNAIISAARKDMIGATLYIVGKEKKTNNYIENAMCCNMCKKLIINAGINQIVIRDNKTDYRIINAEEFKNTFMDIGY